MPQSDSDSDSGWNKELIAAVSKKQRKTKTLSEEDRIKQIQECLNEDADINTVDGNGNTALHTAVKRGYQMVAEFLRKAGARTDILNRNGQTAISLARDLGKQEIMCTLNKPSTSRDSDLTSLNPSLNLSLNSPIRKRPAAAQDSSFDGSLSKMRLINTSQADPQRDVVSDEQRSNRKRTYDELVEHTKRLREMTLTVEKETYVASSLKRSLYGTDCQLKHLMLIVRRVRELNYSFWLATEMNAAEKFNDSVLRYKDSNGDEMYRFLKAKHDLDEDKEISAKDLSNTKNGDFSLLKYFVSWRKIEKNPIFGKCRSKNFVLCTNIGLKVNDLKKRNITVVEETETDDILDVRNVTSNKKQPRRYKLSIKKTSSMWKTLKTGTGFGVTDYEISHFLNEFFLAVNQPNEMELSEIIERGIGTEFEQTDIGIVKNLFQIKMLDWFKTKKGTFLTDVDADNFFNELKGKLWATKTMAVGLNHMKKLEELGIRFNGVNTMIQDFISRPTDSSEQLLEIISPKQTLLTALQVCQTLAQRQKLYKNEIFTFVRLEILSRLETSKLVLETFKWSADQNLLIVDCESISAKQHVQSLWNPICEIMAKNVNKKMILITQAGKDLGSECCLDRQTCYVDNTEQSFENLTDESQKKLLGKRVTKFQGTNNSTNFAELLDIQNWENLREDELRDLSNIMDTDSLVKLISEDELQIGCELDGLEDVGDYYVNRTIFRHVVIKEEILKDTEIPDLLAISGIDGILSDRTMRTERTSDMDNTLGVSSIERCIPDELLQIGGSSSTTHGPANFITLARNQEEKQFNALCAKHKDRNVHWLKIEQGKYIWEKSQGNITHLVQYRDNGESMDNNDKTRVTHLDEDQLTVHNEPVIISDTAGMGKSTMLTYLASRIKKYEPDMLVLKINLNDHSPALAEVKEKRSYDLGSTDGAIQFLVEQLLRGETNFARKVFKRIIKRNHKVAVIFDEFDEISPTYEQTVIDILQTLANYGIRKLLVATRPHTRESLEAKLNAFSFEIRPFSTYDQERFLTCFWRTKFKDSHHELNPTAEDRIRKYTVAIMGTLADSIKDHRNKFTAIPLQAKLVAEILEPQNEGMRQNFDSCQDLIASEADEPKFPKKINLIHLYEHLVWKKFEIFFKKRGGNLTDVAVLEDKELRYQSYIAKHEKLALDTLFDKDTVEELQLSQRGSSYGPPDSTDLRIPIERDGIITQFIDGQPRFEHQTYAEYFAAKFFSNTLKKHEPDKLFGKILVAHVLLKDKYETMRAFMNGLLSDEYRDVLQGEFWKLLVKEHRSEKKETVFHLAAAEGNGGIIRIFLNCFGANKEDRKAILHARDLVGKTAVHRAVEHGNSDVIKLLAEDTEFEINCQDEIGRTPLYRAAEMGSLEVGKYLIDKGADVKLQAIYGMSPLHAATRNGELEMVKYLLEKGANIDSRTDSGSTPLHVAAERGEIGMVGCFLKAGADVNLPTNDGETPLYTAAKSGKLKMVEYLLERGANINSRTNDGETLLHAAACGGELFIADCFLEKGADVNFPTNSGQTPLFIANSYGHWKMFKYLLEKGANINSRTNDGSTLLHAAARGGELDIAVHLLKKGAAVNFPTNNGQTPLFIAHQCGHREMVKYLLKKGADINSQTTDGETLLHVAVRKGELVMADYLLENGADINSQTYDGETLLHAAAEIGKLEMFKYLLENGANINSRTNDGSTLVHAAARGGELGIAVHLLKKGANVNLPTNDGQTPLHIAAQYGRLEMIKYLLEKGAYINVRTNNGSTPLHAAARGGELGIADYLLKKGANVNLPTNDGETPLYTAAQYCRSEMVKYLLEKGADVNSRTNDGSTPLHVAGRGGELGIADYLLEKGADVDLRTNDGETPLYIATEDCQSEMVKYLLKKGANINSRTNDGSTPIHAAAREDELGITVHLLKKGADVNLPTYDGKTPLYTAVQYGRSKMIEYLLETGADFNSPTNDGETPLYTAAQNGRWETVKYLLEKGANINFRTHSGLTLLHAAARGGKLDIADYLLEKGADVDLPTNDRETPLYIAAQYGRLEIVKYLLEKGANINSQSNEGRTALDIASDMGRKDIVKYLLKMGATGHYLPTEG